MKFILARWRTNFFTGLAIVLPGVISIAVVKWLFGTVSNLTNILLIFLPQRWIRHDGTDEPNWYWSLFALIVAIIIVAVIGGLTRNYVGKKLIELLDELLLRVPLLNKIYGAIKQVNDAFGSSNKSSFKQVVLVEFPRDGVFSIGFVTGEQHQEVQLKTQEKVVSIFVPTTPNPTSGFLILVPESKLTKLDMSVADGIKFIISLGAVAPDYNPTKTGLSAAALSQLNRDSAKSEVSIGNS